MATLHVTSKPGAGKSAVAAGLRVLLGPGAQIVEGEGSPQLVVAAYRGDQTLDGVAGTPIGVILNQVPTPAGRIVEREIRPALQARGIPLLGVIPEERALRSARVGDLAEFLGGEVIAGHDSLDNEFQSLMIGAMSHQGATTVPYFMRMEKKIVVTGGDRIDIHMGALRTPTQAIVATGGYAPDPVVIERAEAENVPIVAVLPETPEIVERVGQFFEQSRFRETNAAAMADLIRQHVDLAPIRSALGQQAVTA